MRLLKIALPIILVLLTGCNEYEKGDIVLVQQDANVPPFKAVIRYKLESAPAYGVTLCDENAEVSFCEIPSRLIVRKVTDATETPEGLQNEKLQTEKDAKQKLLWCGFIPMLLVLLSAFRPEGLVLSIPYVLIACILWTPFVFFSVLIVFMIMSVLAVTFLGFLLTMGDPRNPIAILLGTIVYLILLFGMIF